MIAEVIRGFRDKTTGELRNVGDRFEVDSGRFAAINATRYGTLVSEVTGATERPEVQATDQMPDKAEKTTKMAVRGRRRATKEQ